MSEVTRLLRLGHVMDRTGRSRSTIYEWIAAGRMPSPIAISDRTTGWVEREIEDFVRARIAAARFSDTSAGSVK
jgi:prophage regulatory protein